MQAADHLSLRGGRLEDLPTRPVLREGPFCPPPCECPDCNNGFYSRAEQRYDFFCYQRRISDAEARQILAKYTAQAQQDRDHLRQQCASYGDRIMSRWRKRSRDKREAWLLKAKPDLYHQRWFVAHYTLADPHWKDARKIRECLLLPYLSVDLLKKDPAVFLGLLHNRTHYTPEMWAPWDSKELTVGWAMGFFDLDFHEGCVVMHGLRYGELVPWEPESAHRSDIIGFPRARLILEAQACLLSFLRRVVDQILEEADMQNPSGSAKWMDMTISGWKKSGDLACWSQYTYQAFSAPPMFDVDAILTETKAQLDSVADHLWLLQTQPSYMRRYVQSMQQNAVLKGFDGDEWRFRAIAQEVSHDIHVVWFWQAVLDEFTHTKDLHRRFRDSIAPGQPLPRKYDEVLGSLELLLVNSMHHQSKHLLAVIPQRPGFRHLWTFKPASVPGQFLMEHKTFESATAHFEAEPLDWCLIQLQGAPDEQRRFDHGMLFDFLDEHLAQSPARERARLDEMLFAKLSTYAATSELLCAVRMHRPQNKYRDATNVIKTDDRLAWRFFAQTAKEPAQETRPRLAALLKKFHDVGPPPPLLARRGDDAPLKHFDATHETLDTFWRALTEAYRESIAKLQLPPDDVQRVLAFLLGHDSAEHAAAVRTERDRIVKDIEASLAAAAPPLSEATPFQAPESNTAPAKLGIQQQQRKRKHKTRPQQPFPAVTANADVFRVPMGDAVVPGNEETAADAGPKLAVANKRSFGVFMAMFPESAQEASKLVDWDTFVHAMADAGFTARNNGGSAVVFQNDGNNNNNEMRSGGKIIFHKPHPVPKIDPVMMHSMGKRMRRRFDWRRDTFVLGGER